MTILGYLDRPARDVPAIVTYLRAERSTSTISRSVLPNRIVNVLTFAMAAMGIACGGGTEPRNSTSALSGTWIGSLGANTLMLNLTERNGIVTGDGSSYLSTFWARLIVTGSYSAPNLSLTLATSTETATLQATVTDARITGTVAGSASTGTPVMLQSSSTVGVGVPVSVSITARRTTIEPGIPDTLWAVATDKFGNRLSRVSVTWASSSGSVATIAPSAADNVTSAVVTQVGPGVVTITATAAGGGGTASGTVQLMSTNSPWIGRWMLATVNGLPVPWTLSGSGFPIRYISRVMDIRADGTGSWVDSTLSGAQCTPKSTTAMCDASGRGEFTWTANGTTLGFTSAVNPVGVFPLRVFTKAVNGALANISDGHQTAFFRP